MNKVNLTDLLEWAWQKGCHAQRLNDANMRMADELVNLRHKVRESQATAAERTAKKGGRS